MVALQVIGSCTLEGYSFAQEVELKAAAAAKAKQEAEAKKVLERAPSKRLAIALLKQGWQIGAPQISIGKRLSCSFVHGCSCRAA